MTSKSPRHALATSLYAFSALLSVGCGGVTSAQTDRATLTNIATTLPRKTPPLAFAEFLDKEAADKLPDITLPDLEALARDLEQVRKTIEIATRGGFQTSQTMLATYGASFELLAKRAAIIEYKATPSSCGIYCLSQLESIYDTISVPVLTNKDSEIVGLLRLAKTAVEDQRGKPLFSDKFLTGARVAMDRARARQLWAARQVLQQLPDSETSNPTIEHLADYYHNQEQFARSASLYLIGARRTVKAERRRFLINAIRACAAALDLTCFDREYAALQRLPTPEPTEEVSTAAMKAELRSLMQGLARRRGWLQTYTEHQARARAQPDIATELEVAAAAAYLSRYKDADQRYNSLRKRYPDDARPLAGLAKVEVMRTGSVTRAVSKITAARPLKNKDKTFYRIALMTWYSKFLHELGPQLAKDKTAWKRLILPLIPKFRADLEGLAKFDPERAAVFAKIVDVLLKAIPVDGGEFARGDKLRKILDEGIQTARELFAKHPKAIDPYSLVLAATRLQPTEPWADKLLRTTPPFEDADRIAVDRLRSYVLYARMLHENDESLAAPIKDALAYMRDNGDNAALLYADSLTAAVAAFRAFRTNDKSAWSQVERQYKALLVRASDDKTRARFLNNLAVAQFRQGKVTLALLNFEAAKPDAESEAPNFNIAVIERSAPRLRVVLRRSQTATALKIQAAAWLQRLGALGQLKGPTVDSWTPVILGDAGCFLDQSFHIGLGYRSLMADLVTNYDLNALTWLILSAPTKKQGKATP